jgi:hypothetical protein
LLLLALCFVNRKCCFWMKRQVRWIHLTNTYDCLYLHFTDSLHLSIDRSTKSRTSSTGRYYANINHYCSSSVNYYFMRQYCCFTERTSCGERLSCRVNSTAWNLLSHATTAKLITTSFIDLFFLSVAMSMVVVQDIRVFHLFFHFDLISILTLHNFTGSYRSPHQPRNDRGDHKLGLLEDK